MLIDVILNEHSDSISLGFTYSRFKVLLDSASQQVFEKLESDNVIYEHILRLDFCHSHTCSNDLSFRRREAISLILVKHLEFTVHQQFQLI